MRRPIWLTYKPNAGDWITAVIVVWFLWWVGLFPAHAQGVSPNQMFGCNQSAQYNASTNGATKLVTGTATKQIYVCGWNIMPGGTVSVSFVYGTGGTCGTGQAAVTPPFALTAQIAEVDHLPVYTGIPPVPVSNDLCILTNAGVAVQAIVYYTQF
jgi:hypothetical protein